MRPKSELAGTLGLSGLAKDTEGSQGPGKCREAAGASRLGPMA